MGDTNRVATQTAGPFVWQYRVKRRDRQEGQNPETDKKTEPISTRNNHAQNFEMSLVQKIQENKPKPVIVNARASKADT